MSEDLVGVWALESYELVLDGGEVVQPIGAEPVGRLVYTRDGFMSAHLMERSDAPVSYLAYSGCWHVQGGEVHHEVDISSRPKMVGTIQRRLMDLSGDNLTLVAMNAPWRGQQGRGELAWRRVGS